MTRQPVLLQLFLFEHETNQSQRHSKSKPSRIEQSDPVLKDSYANLLKCKILYFVDRASCDDSC